MVISILGCGWFGRALAVKLVQNNVTVKGSVTSAGKFGQLQEIGVLPYLVLFEADSQTVDPDFFGCDVLIICIPPRVRAGEGNSYLYKIQSIIETAISFNVKKVIYISSTGVYGDCDAEVDELMAPRPDTEPGSVLLKAEELFQKQAELETTIIRFGGLVGPGRHPGRFFAGKRDIPNGMAPVNLIHQQDCVGITEAVIEQNVFGILLNACSPGHPAKAMFYREMALNANLPLPEFINELKNWKVVNSVNIGAYLKYDFTVKHWDDAGLFD